MDVTFLEGVRGVQRVLHLLLELRQRSGPQEVGISVVYHELTRS